MVNRPGILYSGMEGVKSAFHIAMKVPPLCAGREAALKGSKEDPPWTPENSDNMRES